MPKISPFLWFDGQAEQAAKFYTSVFSKSKIVNISRYGSGKAAPVMSATFKILGQDFIALNGGPQFKFSPAISFFVTCKTQKEVDHLWKKLGAGGEIQQCGWLKDKFGVSWQIIPEILGQLLSDKDRTKAGRVMEAMLGMKKIEIQKLKKAHAGK